MKTKFNRKNALAAAIASTIKAAGHKPGEAPASSLAGAADALEGSTRRDFVKAGAAGALLLSGGMVLVGCSDRSPDDSNDPAGVWTIFDSSRPPFRKNADQ